MAAEIGAGWMTIEELSRQAGVTSRNIRAYQSRGLLPPPVSRAGARTGFYTPEHLTRLRLVDRLQQRGFSLAGIAHLLSAWTAGQDLDQVLGLETALASAREESARWIAAEELTAQLPEGVEAADAVPRLLAVGLLDRHGEGYRIRSPEVWDLGIEAVAAGIPFDALLDEYVRLRSDLGGIALRFVNLFTRHVLDPFAAAGGPDAGIPEILSQAGHLRQLAVEAAHGLMRQAMADEIELATREHLAELDPKR